MLTDTMAYIRAKTDFVPDIALVLGSGLGDFSAQIEKVCELNYSALGGIPVSTAPSHHGRFILGRIGDKKVIAMDGRVHLYEGYTAGQVVMPIRLMRLLGAKTLLLTNACGGINKRFNAGDLMMITDQISCFVPSPLIGKNDDTLGVHFPDMSRIYSKRMQAVIKNAAKNCGVSLKEGVYAQLTGPQFESPAEIKMLSTLGADAVGMSTAIEAIAAVHCGFEVGGISLVTNLACGILDQPLSGEEVGLAAEKAMPQFSKLLKEVIGEL